ncbi:TPA: hypothetical protein ACH3X2_006715 [Trebouxia sp. C0005]
MVQAQAQQQAEITFTESLEVVRCLLRVVTGVLWRRTNKWHLSAAAGLQIMMLKPDTPESRLLVDWVEGGVYDALKQKYLKCLLFGISEDEQGSCLMEEYVYKFNYDNDGGVTVDLTTNGKPVEKSNKKKPDASAHLQDLGQYARRGEMTQQVIGSTPYATCPFIWPASNPLLPPSPPFRPRLSAQPPSPDHVDACPDSMAY